MGQKSLPIFPRRRSSKFLLILGLLIFLAQFLLLYHFGSTINEPAVADRVEQTIQPFLLRNDNNSSFSACLLVMDDNHFLIEWLAYHFTTLPLRYLVIAVDPRSKISPNIILNRWESYMTIVRWNDKHFLPVHWQNRIMREDDPTGLLMKHRERQRHFYPACFEFLKQAGRQWTLAADIDEFVIAPNPHFINITQMQQKQTGGSPTLLQLIQDNTPRYHAPNQSCITIPRLRFGNFENANTTQHKLTPKGFPDEDFLTYRWRYRAGLHDRKQNRNPKSMVHLQRISNFSRQDTDAHLPVRSACPKRNMYILNRDSPYSMHHYSGSTEQFGFRNDARDGTPNRAKISQYGKIQDAMDTSAASWLPTFIDKVGLDAAKTLLEGVGNVSYTSAIAAQMMQEGYIL